MIKIITFVLFFATFINARMIGAVALSVDGEPITTTEIKRLQALTHMSKKQAIDTLINKKLEKRAIEKSGIFVNDIDIDKAIENIAKQNGVDVNTLKKEVAKQGISFKQYRENIATGIKKERLLQKIAAGRIKKPDDADLKAFYNQHKREFTIPGSIEISEYSAPKGEYLQALQRNPMLNPKSIKGLRVRDAKIDPRRVNPELLKLLMKTPNGKFTPIINTGRGFVMFFVKRKNRAKTVPFEKVKNQIFPAVMKEKEAQILNEYFQKLRSEAIIKKIRDI